MYPRGQVAAVGRSGGTTRGELTRWPELQALLRAGEQSRSFPGGTGYRPDRFTAELALRYLELARPRLLVVGLGDTDEHAHHDRYDLYLSALRDADRFIGAIFSALASSGRYGSETTVLVTTDHGRAADFIGHGSGAPESARVFLLAGGGAIPRRGLVATSGIVRLADVGRTMVALLGAAPAIAFADAAVGRPLREIVPESSSLAHRGD